MTSLASEPMAERGPAKPNAIDQAITFFADKPTLLGALLLLVTLLLYSPVAHHDFLQFDDAPYVTKNPHVNTGLKLGNVVWAFTAFHEGNWHPLTWISHMADCQYFGLSSGPHHLVNLALHAVNVLLLFYLLYQATRAVWRSFFVAALFAVHPLNVESIAWVAQRKTLLCTLFSLFAVAAYGRYVRLPGWTRYAVVAGLFALALMSKPMGVTLPLVFLLLDYWPLRRYPHLSLRSRWLRLMAEKLPLLLMSAASSAVTIAAQRAGGAVAEASALPLYVRLENAIVSYVGYMERTLWPAGLSVFYPHRQHALPLPEVVASAVLLTGITLAVLYWRRERYLVVGWFFFLITLVPVIGIVQVGRQAMADRYSYIPCVGLFVLIAWGLGDLADMNPSLRLVPITAAFCLTAGLAAVTVHYLAYWQNGTLLFTRAEQIARNPDPAIEEALGDALFFAGHPEEAFRHYREACTAQPQYAVCHYNMAEMLFNQHQLNDALEQYRLAVTYTNNKNMAVSSLINSGEILLELGDYQTAQMRIASALEIDPSNQEALRLQQRAYGQ